MVGLGWAVVEGVGCGGGSRDGDGVRVVGCGGWVGGVIGGGCVCDGAVGSGGAVWVIVVTSEDSGVDEVQTVGGVGGGWAGVDGEGVWRDGGVDVVSWVVVVGVCVGRGE